MPTIYKPEKKRKKKQTNNASERRKERQRFYNTPQWKELTQWYKKKNPLCEMCLQKGKTTPVEAVHHIDSPFREGLTEEEKWGLMLDIDNLMSVCVDCHLEIHGIKDPRLEKYRDLPHV